MGYNKYLYILIHIYYKFYNTQYIDIYKKVCYSIKTLQ
jgi:hypothetical protein